MTAILTAAILLVAAHAAPATAATVWATGDGATGGTNDDAVAAFIKGRPAFDRFLYLGDVYETGSPDDYRLNYQPTYGAFRNLSSPTSGDNEWGSRASGYDPYWGSLAPQQPDGGHYYSFDLGGWHIVSLNDNEPSESSSPQVAWLRRDLARYKGTCTLAFFHRPRYFAGRTQADPSSVEPFWGALAGRAVAVLSGHIHNYQRLTPNRGITQFVVGTGGRALVPIPAPPPPTAAPLPAGPSVADSEVTFGALRLTLNARSAVYAFFRTGGSTGDSGSLSCRPHTGAPSVPPPVSTAQPVFAPLAASGQPPAGSTAPGVAAAPAATRARTRISISRPRSGRAYSGRPRLLAGTSRGARGRIVLRLVRRTGRGCSAFTGRRFRRASCRSRTRFTASGRSSWRYRLRRGLPSGSYVLVALAAGADGRLVSTAARFRVR